MTFVYLIATRWVSGPADPSRMERVLDNFEDWFRYNQSTWLVATVRDAHTVSQTIQNGLATSDSVLVIQVATYTGFAPKMTWDWLGKYSGPLDATANVFGPFIHKS